MPEATAMTEATAMPEATAMTEATAMPEPTSTPRPTPTPTPIPAPVFGGVPDLPDAQYGGTLIRTNSAEGPTWDPLKERTQNTQDPISPMFDQLLISHPNEPSQLVPQIASTWEISADNLTYTFGVRDDITFHNGSQLTASDAAWTLELLRNPPEGYSPINRGLVGSIASIATPDDTTLVINLSGPDNAFLYAMGHGRLHIVDQETVEGAGGVASLTEWPPVGSGPFMGEPGGHDQGVGVEVVRNPNYYVEGRPFVDSMQWFFIPDRGAQEAAFLAGQLSILAVNTGAGIDEILSRLANEAFIQEVADTVFWDLNLDFHSEDSPFTNIKVREAVSLALNRAEAIELIRQGRGVLGGVIIPGTGWEIPTSELLQYSGYTETVDEGVAKAKALMAEAGYPDGFESTIWTRNHPAYLTPTVAMQEQLERIGIRANILQAEQAVFFAEQRNLEVWDMQSGGHRYTGTDPNFMIREFYLTDATRNLNYFTDPDVDRLFSEQNLEADPGKRRELVNQIEHIVVSFYGNPVLYYNKANYAMYNYVKNQEFHSSYGSNQDFRDVWVER
jgi:peptide/nickel transport system substrate-binding protein